MTGYFDLRHINVVFSELDHRERIRSVIDNRFHFIHHIDNNKKKLYNVQKDPYEKVNIANTKPNEIKKYQKLLKKYEDAAQKEYKAGHVELNEEQYQHLRSLGYL